ncbi:MAG: hypothetical protein PHX51_07245 [Clostridia bacterium]|nr:hypothetical protein [Clostridia bacterium]
MPDLFEKPLDVKSAANFLSMKIRGLYMNTFRFDADDKRAIPHYKAPNGRVYFYASELNEWIQSDSYGEEDQSIKEPETKLNETK